MEKLNRNNADIEKLRGKKVAVRLVGKDAEIDFIKWIEETGINFDKEDTPITNGIINEICYYVEENSLDCYYKGWFIQKGWNLYEWEIAEKTCTIKDVVENEGKVYKCITDSNSGVLYKYIDDVLYATYNRIEWKKSLVKLRKLLKYEFIEYKPEPKEIKDAKPLTEEQKAYTIKDVVENEGKVYKCITDSNNGVLYKYIDDVLYATYNRIEWKKSLIKLRKLLKYEFIEYKPEPKKITFEEALKEMETKVCRCLFSNRCITIKGSQFIDVIDINTAGYTSLSVSEIKSEWVVVNE